MVLGNKNANLQEVLGLSLEDGKPTKVQQIYVEIQFTEKIPKDWVNCIQLAGVYMYLISLQAYLIKWSFSAC